MTQISREELWAILDAHKGQVSSEALEWAKSVIAGEIDLSLRGPFKTFKQFKAERGKPDNQG
jgi:hypothetical protein